MNIAITPRAQPLPASSRPPVLRLLGLTAATALMLAACATRIAAPTQELALSRAAIESAVRAGAAEMAPRELNIAQQKQALADTAMTQEQYDRAGMLSTEVVVDARLAETKARGNRAAKAAAELREDSRVLHQEISRPAQ